MKMGLAPKGVQGSQAIILSFSASINISSQSVEGVLHNDMVNHKINFQSFCLVVIPRGKEAYIEHSFLG